MPAATMGHVYTGMAPVAKNMHIPSPIIPAAKKVHIRRRCHHGNAAAIHITDTSR